MDNEKYVSGASCTIAYTLQYDYVLYDFHVTKIQLIK